MRGRDQTHRSTPRRTAEELSLAQWLGNRRPRFEQIGGIAANRGTARRQSGVRDPGESCAKQGSPAELTRFSCFSLHSGTVIASNVSREAVRIDEALPEKPEPCRFQTSTPTGKRAGLGCNLPGRAPLLPVGYLCSLGLPGGASGGWMTSLPDRLVRGHDPGTNRFGPGREPLGVGTQTGDLRAELPRDPRLTTCA